MKDSKINKHITINRIKANNAKEYKTAGDFSDTTFWYYTNENAVLNIHKSKYFLVSSISNMNDRDEFELHNNASKFKFALCFCNSEKEEIPMWYLYSGILGAGMTIGITPFYMLCFIDSIMSIYRATQDKLTKEWKPVGKELIRNKDFDIQYDWVYYYDSHKVLNYRNKTYAYTFNNCEFEKIFFIKKAAWEYEKEFRIVISIHKNAFTKFSKYDKVFVKIPNEVTTQFRYKIGPESKYTDFGSDEFKRRFGDILYDIVNIKSKMSKAKLIKKFIKKSDLDIKMNLLDRNHDAIITYYICHKDKIDKELKSKKS